MTSIELSNGRVYTGWRALPWLLLFLPIIVPWLLFGVALYVIRWFTGKDRVLGYEYNGKGTWTRA